MCLTFRLVVTILDSFHFDLSKSVGTEGLPGKISVSYSHIEFVSKCQLQQSGMIRLIYFFLKDSDKYSEQEQNIEKIKADDDGERSHKEQKDVPEEETTAPEVEEAMDEENVEDTELKNDTEEAVVEASGGLKLCTATQATRIHKIIVFTIIPTLQKTLTRKVRKMPCHVHVHTELIFID